MSHAINHNLSSVYWIAEHYPTIKRGYSTYDREHYIVQICTSGNLDMLKWSIQYLTNSRFPGSEDLFIVACDRGDIEMITWICERFQNIGKNYANIFHDAFEQACMRGHIHVAEWLLNRYHIDVYDDSVLKAACLSNKTAVLEWLTIILS